MEMYGKHGFSGRLFIVEGIDGSGKSTQLSLLHKWLESETARRKARGADAAALR